LGVAGLVAAAVFALGSTFSVLGRTVEGSSSLFGVSLYIVWLLLVALCLWQAARTAAPLSEAEHEQ
jgi:apolipoprotein N-acyltransferase